MRWPSPKRALVIAVVSTLVGCSAHALPPTAPGTSDNPLRVVVTSSAMPLIIEAASAYPEVDFSLEVRGANYRQGVAALRRGDAHLMVTSHLRPEDAQVLWAAPLTTDVLALIAHPSVVLDGLSIAQLRMAYQGQVNDWAQWGGAPLPLTVVSREAGADVRAEFERLVMGARRTTGAALTTASDAGVLALVRETVGAVGYVPLSMVEAGVRVLSIDGVLPSTVTLTDQTYPLRSTVYAVALAEPTDSARRFIAWLQSPDGQAVLMRRFRPPLTIPR
ncbi:MAG: substrate-binding domain-containing protein [Anaerolineae bacterium]|nr:substrate-binding domain-containing protein [Anaerolineae bacterium]